MLKYRRTTKRGPEYPHNMYYTQHFLSTTYLPGMSFVCAPNIDTQNSNPASISFINIEQNSSGPLSCSLCAKRQTHDGNECLCIASHVPSFQPMQLSITYWTNFIFCALNLYNIILPLSGRCCSLTCSATLAYMKHSSMTDSKALEHYFCTGVISLKNMAMGDLWLLDKG